MSGNVETLPPRRAMVLAAGFGKRMRPMTATTPKPLIEVNGKALIDHGLDRLEAVGVDMVVVNVHYLADLIESHLRRRPRPRITVSDERDALLDTGGGVKRALGHFGGDPFYVLNSDTVWIEGATPNLRRLASAWDPQRMDAILLLAATASSVGYDGCGDFALDADGRIRRRRESEVVPFVYAGVMIVHPRLFDGAPEGEFSLNRLFDKAIEDGRLHGIRMEGVWMHVGTPSAIREAEACIAQSAA